ncbi:MAG: hypothetical protein ACYDEX_04525 [Mobilitalea sp.]
MINLCEIYHFAALFFMIHMRLDTVKLSLDSYGLDYGLDTVEFSLDRYGLDNGLDTIEIILC